MQETKKAFRKLRKALPKVRINLNYAHDIKTLNSSYEIDTTDKATQEQIKRALETLERQRKTIRNCSETILKKIDQAIENLRHFLTES